MKGYKTKHKDRYINAFRKLAKLYPITPALILFINHNSKVRLNYPPSMPGQQKEIDLKVYQGAYVLMGPITPGVHFRKACNRDILNEFIRTAE